MTVEEATRVAIDAATAVADALGPEMALKDRELAATRAELAHLATTHQRTLEALEKLVTAVANMRVPQNEAEAAKAPNVSGKVWNRFAAAATPDAILNLIRERDEASALAEQATYQALALEGRAEAAEAALSAAREEVERYKAGITQVAAHIANAGRGEETTNERILDRVDEVLATLTKEPHHG